MLDRSTTEVVLELPYGDGEEEIKVTTRTLPWSVKNRLVSQATKYTTDQEISFSGDFYIQEVLKYIIVSAPWGNTDDVFFTKIDNTLGSALEKLVPDAFGGGVVETADKVKKDSSAT